jgi:uncharacterized protein (TIGR02001 family)
MRLFMYLYCRDENQQSLGRSGRILAHAALMAAGLLAAHPAHGQVSASVSLTSEYSARGVSLSDGRATPQLSIAYDTPRGWYAGAFAAPGVALGELSSVTQLVAYAGYARRLASGLSWEAGASSTTFQHASEYNYREVFAGLASDRVSGRLYFAPAYYGYGGRVAYGELDGFHPLREHIRLSAHIGLLHGLSGITAQARDRIDLRLALGFDAGACNLQLAWLGSASLGRGPRRDFGRSPRSLALSASYSF